MSLFRFGFRPLAPATSQATSEINEDDFRSTLPTLSESGLGVVEYQQVATAVSKELAAPSAKRRRSSGTYTTYTPTQRAKIGKYALEHCNEKARKHFLSRFPNLPESTVRHFKKAYREELEKKRKKCDPQPVVEITAKPRGRPPILLDLDEKLIKFLKAIRAKGGVVNIHVVRATTDALIGRNPSSSMHLQNFSKSRSWVQSLYRRMGYTRRASTTSRPPAPEGLCSECRRDYLQDIDSKIKKCGIPPELVLNSDQTPSSYVHVSVGKSTMARKGSTTIPIKGVTDKRAITLNFVVTLANDFLPMQVIYTGKTKLVNLAISDFLLDSVLHKIQSIGQTKLKA